MTRSCTLVLALAACGVTPEGFSESAEISEELLELGDLGRIDVRGAAAAVLRIAGHIHARSPDQRARAMEDLASLAVTCPYTRNGLQIPYVLQRVAMGIDPDELDPLVRRDWSYLSEGLSVHTALLDSLGVELASPGPGDALYDEGAAPMPDLKSLLGAADPFDIAMAMVERTTAAAERLDATTRDRVAQLSARVEESTGVARACGRGPWAVVPGQPWMLRMQLNSWHDALRRVEPFALTPEAAHEIGRMIALLKANARASEVSVAAVAP